MKKNGGKKQTAQRHWQQLKCDVKCYLFWKLRMPLYMRKPQTQLAAAVSGGRESLTATLCLHVVVDAVATCTAITAHHSPKTRSIQIFYFILFIFILFSGFSLLSRVAACLYSLLAHISSPCIDGECREPKRERARGRRAALLAPGKSKAGHK